MPTKSHAPNLVYIVDDDDAVRESLAWLLHGRGFLVKHYASAEAFLLALDPDQPACLLVDVRMEGMSGIELQERLLELRTPLPLAFISGHGDIPLAVAAIQKGAFDFIQKPFDANVIIALVDKLLAQALTSFGNQRRAQRRQETLGSLTPREREVFDQILAGKRNREISEFFAVSVKTIEAHRANILLKCGAHNLSELLHFALGNEHDERQNH